MYELWDRALVLRKKNLPGRGLTEVEKHRCNFFGAGAIWVSVGRTAKRVSGTNGEVSLIHNLIPYLYYVTEPGGLVVRY